MISRRSHRKPDFFSVVLLLVTLATSVTVIYQMNSSLPASGLPIAERSAVPKDIAGG